MFLFVFRQSVPENEGPIPRFNTRRSLRQGNSKWKYDASNMPPVMLEGPLERKQQSQSGGKRSTLRSWKTYYTVLSGQILCFFKDQNDFKDAKAAAAPILIQHAQCEKATDYTKKKNVIRLVTQDGSEFLFHASSKEELDAWIEKLLLCANLDPSESVKQSSKQSTLQRPPPFVEGGGTNGAEPLYANMEAVGANNDENNQQNSQVNEHDVSSISEIDAKKRSKLSKFLNRKPKVSTS